MNVFLAACLALVCALLPLSASAGAWQGSAGLAIKHFRFDEISPQGSRLVRENGLLPGIALRGGYASADWDLSLGVSAYSGSIDYDGRTQGGQPLESDTDQTFYEFDLLGRYRLPLHPQPVSLYLVASAEHRLWERRIQGTAGVAGLDEDYRWQRLGIGAACEYRTTKAGRWHLQGRIIHIVQPQVEVDFETAFDDATLDLKARNGWRLDAGWSRDLGENTDIAIAAFLEYWAFGRSDSETLNSNGVPVGTVFQPRGEGREAGISASLVRRW